jgi:hypothetical protein
VTESATAVSPVSYEAQPNIYHIVLDGYTSSQALRQDFGFDNSAFENQLKTMGFDIPKHSYSNYENTAESLASELNMEMVQFFLPANEVDPNKLKLIEKMVNSRVRSFLEGEGYQTIAFENEFRWSLWTNADIYLSPRNRNFLLEPINSFERLCLQNSIAGLLFTSYDSLFFSKPHEESVLENLDKFAEQSYIIDKLPETTAYLSPKFVFAHTTFTHVPFVFALDGSVLPAGFQGSFRETDFDDPQVRAGYIISIQYANEQILEIVKGILKKDPNAIIILQGDHGYPGANRQQIFLAVYDPKRSIAGMECMTPVNLYRLIFNRWFGTDYSLLSNTLFTTLDRMSYQYEAFATCESLSNP